MQISFKGQLVSNMNIKRAGYDFPAKKASIVELNPLEYHDLRTLREINELWDGTLASCICKDAECINIGQADFNPQKFFVLTTQRENFKRMNPDDILAEAEVVLNQPSKGKIYLEYLQVDPDNMFDSEAKLYEGLGTTFLNFLKKHYNGLEIHLNAVCSAVDFYLKNGFTLVKNSTLMKFVK